MTDSSSYSKRKESSNSEGSENEGKLEKKLFSRSKTENIANSKKNNLLFQDMKSEYSKRESKEIGQQSSPRGKLTENDEEKPINRSIIKFLVNPPKNFQRSPEKPGAITSSPESSDSSLDDYTISKKQINTMHERERENEEHPITHSVRTGAGKKIETLTDAPFINKSVKYRNSNIISFGNKQGTHNFSEYGPRKTSIIKEEAEILDKNDEEKPQINEVAKNLLPPDSSPSKISKKSKQVENFLLSSNDSPRRIPTQTTKFTSKLYKLISEFYIVKKFMNILMNSTIYRKPKKLKDYHYAIINDWSDFHNKHYSKSESDSKKKTFFHKISENLKYKIVLLKKRNKRFARFVRMINKLSKFVFHPTHTFKIVWDFIHLILILVFLIIIPLNLGFSINILEYYSYENPVFFPILKNFSFIFFILDLLVTMNTAYYHRGELIFGRRDIVLNYLKGQFIWDFLSLIYLFDVILGFSFISHSVTHTPFLPILGLLFLSRVLNLQRIMARIEEFMFIEEKLYNSLSLMRLICFVIFLSHLFACLWHYIASERDDFEVTWIQIYGLSNVEWWVKYIYSFYYVVIVMNTVGFGDIVPQTHVERVYSIFFIYVACGVFAYTINSIGLILQDINKKNHRLKRTILLINSYMNHKKISIDLRIRIRKYLEYIGQEERVQDDVETHDIINKLSKSLKEELLLNANGIVLREFPLFYMNFSEDSLKKLVYHIEEISLTPGDLIYSINEKEADQCIYIIRKGEVELFVETPRSTIQNITILKTLKANHLFGEYSFFSENPRETSARSSSFTTLFAIKKDIFLSIIKANSDDYEIYCQMKDRLNLYKEMGGLYSKCHACQQNDHDIISCPMMHLTLSRYRILQRYNHSKPQIRSQYKRNCKKDSHALKNYEKNENLAQKFYHDMNSEEEDDSDDSSDVSTSNIMQIKRDFNRASSDLSVNPNTMLPTDTPEQKQQPTIPSLSPKFQEIANKKPILRFPSRISEMDKSFSNNTILITSPINLNNSNNNLARKSRSFSRKKPGTTVVHRQNSTDSISKNSIYSKKSSKSNKSIKFFPYEVNLTQNSNEEQKMLALPKNIRSSNRNLSNISSIRQNTDDFSEYMLYLRKNKHPQEPSEPTINSKSQRSRESKKSKKSTDKSEEKQADLGIAPPTTMFELDKMNYGDIAKSYEFYFPHNNLENVLEKIKNDAWLRRRKKLNSRGGTKTEIVANAINSVERTEHGSLQGSGNYFRRRGGNIEIFKGHNSNFFKKRQSLQHNSNIVDKKKFGLILEKKYKSRKKKGGKLSAVWTWVKLEIFLACWKCFSCKSKEKPKNVKKEMIVSVKTN